MQIKCGSIITEVSGSLGGHTAQRTRSGLVLGSKTIQRATPSRLQLVQRSRSQVLTQRWRELTQSERNLWLDFEFEGSTGFQSYLLVNSRRLSIPSAILQVPPTFFPVVTNPGFTAIIDQSSDFARVFPGESTAGGYRHMIYATAPVSRGSRIGSSPRVFMVAGTNAAGGFIAFYNQLLARFGQPRSGRAVDITLIRQHVASSVRSLPLTQREIIQF